MKACMKKKILEVKKTLRKDMKDNRKHKDVGNVVAQSYQLQIYHSITGDMEQIYTDRTDIYRVLQSKWAQTEI